VYFSLPILFMVVRYPVTWALPLAVLLALVYVWAVVRARRRRLASLGGVLAAFVIFAVFGALAGFWGWRFSRLMTSLHTRWLAPGSVGNSAPYAALLASVVVTSWCACYALLRRWFAPHSLLLGSAFVWIVLAVVAAWFVPGGSYVLLWPAAASLLSSVALAGPGERGASVGAGRVLLIGILSVPTSLIIWPLVVTLFIAMGLAPESGVALALLTLFGLAALSAPLEVITDGRRWWPAGAALVAACACLGTGIAVTPYSAVHPRAVNMFYVLDADTQTAEWTTKMDGPDAWASQYLGAKPVPGRPRAVLPPWWSSVDGAPGWLKGEAPLADLPAPAATIISSASVEDGQDRTLTLHVKPAAEGHALSVWTNGAPVMEAAIDGKPLKLSTAPRAAHDTRWSVDFVNAAGDGATITLTLRSLAKLTVAVLDRSAGLPAITGKPFGPRPPSIVPINFGDSTFVRRTYTF
jgi:hypothetical protein